MVRGTRALLGDLGEVKDYIDDIMIYTEDLEQPLFVLKEVFGQISSDGLTLRPTKCVLGAESRKGFMRTT